MNYNISLIPGDGIGPEIVAEAKKVLDKVCEKYGHTFSYSEVLLPALLSFPVMTSLSMRRKPFRWEYRIFC